MPFFTGCTVNVPRITKGKKSLEYGDPSTSFNTKDADN